MANGSLPDEQDFLRFWQFYPLKVSKGDARKAWAQTSKIRPPIDEILAALQRYIAFKNASEFLSYKYPATFLRAECWSDEYETPKVEASRPSITCSTCKQQSYFWTDGVCNPCWKKRMGFANG